MLAPIISSALCACTKSVARCVVWGLCYEMLCAIFVPNALTDDLHLTDCLLCVCTLSVTNCWFRIPAKRRKILQCQFVRKRRYKRWQGIFRCRHRSRPSPITCICVKPCVPDAHTGWVATRGAMMISFVRVSASTREALRVMPDRSVPWPSKRCSWSKKRWWI